MTVNIGNQGVAATGAYTAKVSASGIESVTIAQADIGSSVTSNVTLKDTGLKTLTFTSAGNASLTIDGKASLLLWLLLTQALLRKYTATQLR